MLASTDILFKISGDYSMRGLLAAEVMRHIVLSTLPVMYTDTHLEILEADHNTGSRSTRASMPSQSSHVLEQSPSAWDY
jgi:hypothetical protein